MEENGDVRRWRVRARGCEYMGNGRYGRDMNIWGMKGRWKIRVAPPTPHPHLYAVSRCNTLYNSIIYYAVQ